MPSLFLYLSTYLLLISFILSIVATEYDVTKPFYIMSGERRKYELLIPAMPIFTDQQLIKARKTPSKMRSAYVMWYDAVAYCQSSCKCMLGVDCIDSPLSADEFVDALQDSEFRYEVKHGYYPFAFWSNCRCSRNEELNRNDCWALGHQFTRRDGESDGTKESTKDRNEYYYDRKRKIFVWNNGTAMSSSKHQVKSYLTTKKPKIVDEYY